MSRRGALSVSGPLRPIIRIKGTSAANPGRRGLSVYWRQRPKSVPQAAAHRPGPASWALTINLFLKQAFAFQGDGRGRSKLTQEVHSTSAQLPRPVQLLWRAANLRVEHRTDLLRNVLRRLVLPEISSIDRWRTLSRERVETTPADRSAVRSQSLPVLTWGGQRRRSEAAPPLLKPWRDRHFQPLAVVARKRQSPILMPPGFSRRASPAELVVLRSTGASPRRSKATAMRSSLVNPDAVSPQALPRRRLRSWSSVAASWRRGGGPAGSNPALLKPGRPNPPVEMFWSSPRAAASATSLGPSMAIPAESSVTREIGRDLSSMNSVPGAVQSAIPDVDRLVDEVFRRMDRQFRSERLRRGL